MCGDNFCASTDDHNVYSNRTVFLVPLPVRLILESLIIKSLTTIEFREKMTNNYDVSPYA